jgi:hypothetical protein
METMICALQLTSLLRKWQPPVFFHALAFVCGAMKAKDPSTKDFWSRTEDALRDIIDSEGRKIRTEMGLSDTHVPNSELPQE